MHFIGIDIGTTSICGIVYNSSTHHTASVTLANESTIVSGTSWEKMQNLEWIIARVLEIVQKLELQYGDIKGIGITGQMHGILYVDNEGKAVSSLYTWQDERGNLIYDNNITYAEFLSDYSGYNLSTGFGLVTHFYNIKNALLPANAVKICTIMDYAVMKLSGRTTPLMDYTNAAGLGFFNIRENKFEISSLTSIGIDASILPETGESAAFAGYYNSKIPVYSAIGDNQASFIGSVRDRGKSIHVTIGTSSQLSVYSKKLLHLAALDTRPFPGGGYILVGAALSGGQSLSVLQSFFDSVIKLSGNNGSNVAGFYEMINAIEYEENGPTALSVTTLFNGSRSNPFDRGSISNISTTNFTAADVILGFIRGICNEVFNFYNAIPDELKKDKHILIGSGNALKKNKLICKTLERTFNLPVVKSAHDEDAALGASIAAAVGGKYIQDFDSIMMNPGDNKKSEN